MDILIIYATKNGVTERCAKMLGEILEKKHKVTVVSVKSGELPAPEGFDMVFLGSNVRMGAVDKQIRKYAKRHLEALKRIHCGVFLCCGFADEFDEYCDIKIFRDLAPDMGFHCFGGELKPDKLKGLDKLIVKSVRNSIRTKNFEASKLDQIALPEILPESIVRVGEMVRQMMMDKAQEE